MAQNCVLQVSGIPARHHNDDLVLDKLFIHFLRRRNGGNGEVDVRYPTEEEGVAMLTFDRVEVADQVLTRRHHLETQGRAYPLEVSRPQLRRTQFSMPVTATLSLEYFHDTSEVRKLLERHNLRVCGEGSLCLQIEGDFQNLNRCRDALHKTLSDPSLSGRHPTEDRMSRRDACDAKEYRPENYRVSGEEARLRKSNAQQNPGSGLSDGTVHKKCDRNPSPRRSLKSLPADIEGCSPAADKSKPPSIKQPLTRMSRPTNSSLGSSQGKAKDRSSEDSTTSITNHHRWKMAANLNVHSMPPEMSSADEGRRADSNSPLVSGGKSADGSGLASHTAFTRTQYREDVPDSRQPKKEFAADSSSSQSQLKGTIAGEIASSPKHPKSTTRDISDSNPGQPKNVSADKVNSNPRHLKVTTRDISDSNPGQPKNVSADKVNSNPKHLKSTTNSNPGKPRNTSVDESYLNPRYPEDWSASSARTSSIMAAGWSSSSSPTIDSSTAIHSQHYLDQSPLSTEFFVDPAVLTYIYVFAKKKIDDILGQSDVEMKQETCEGFNRVILTARSPDRSQLFYKAVREVSDIFTQGQRFLRAESIDLSEISAEETKNLQLYLHSCGIWSLGSPEKAKLEMIGPSRDILEFMEKWTSARGVFAIFMHLARKGAPPASSRPPAVGMDNVHPPTTRNHNVARGGQTLKLRLKGRGEESGGKEGRRSRSMTPSNRSRQ